METETDLIKVKKDWSIVIIGVIAVLFVVGMCVLTVVYLRPLGETKRGTFGDMFGAVNALFSGLAFAGIILTIVLQMKELGLQRAELTETRGELKRAADAQERSQLALNRQAENLKRSAELSALNSLLNAYAKLEEDARNRGASNTNEYKNKKEKCIYDIQQILALKQNF